MTRRPTVVALVVALAVLLVAESGARLLATRLPGPVYWDTPFSQDKASQIEEAGTVDVVFIGSSIVNAGIDPPLVVGQMPGFGSGYNAALPSTSPITWEVWSRDFILTDLCPAVLVIGVAVRDYSDTDPGTGATLDAYVNSPGRLALYGDGSSEPFDVRAGQWSALLRIRSRLREPDQVIRYLVSGSAPGWPRSNLTPEGRFRGWDTGTLRPDAARDARLERLFDDFAVGGAEDQAVRQMILEARSVGIEPVLVELPVMETELTALLPGGAGDLDAFRAALANTASALGVPLLEFPELADRSDLYGDLYHMNLAGTRELSTALGNELAQLFPGPDPGRSCPARSLRAGEK